MVRYIGRTDVSKLGEHFIRVPKDSMRYILAAVFLNGDGITDENVMKNLIGGIIVDSISVDPPNCELSDRISNICEKILRNEIPGVNYHELCLRYPSLKAYFPVYNTGAEEIPNSLKSTAQAILDLLGRISKV